MLRQGNAQVFKEYSQDEEARSSGEAQHPPANETPAEKAGAILPRSLCSERDIGTVLTRSRPEILIGSGNKVGKYFRIDSTHNAGG
jgi:hypothetical protein